MSLTDFDAIDRLGERLASYHLYHATRGELLRRLGRRDEAATAVALARDLTQNPAERRLLGERLAQLGSERSAGPT